MLNNYILKLTKAAEIKMTTSQDFFSQRMKYWRLHNQSGWMDCNGFGYIIYNKGINSLVTIELLSKWIFSFRQENRCHKSCVNKNTLGAQKWRGKEKPTKRSDMRVWPKLIMHLRWKGKVNQKQYIRMQSTNTCRVLSQISSHQLDQGISVSNLLSTHLISTLYYWHKYGKDIHEKPANCALNHVIDDVILFVLKE